MTKSKKTSKHVKNLIQNEIKNNNISSPMLLDHCIRFVAVAFRSEEEVL